MGGAIVSKYKNILVTLGTRPDEDDLVQINNLNNKKFDILGLIVETYDAPINAFKIESKGVKIKGIDIILSQKQKDENAIRSLFGMNNGRKNMRKALGMDMDIPAKEAIQKFWLLGEFLEMGVPTDNNITVNKDIKDRQDKLDIYKATISTLKKKLEERAEEKKSTKDKS